MNPSNALTKSDLVGTGGQTVNDPIAQLKADHREVEALLKSLANSKPGVRRRSTVAKVERELQRHMRVEERLVYPLIPRILGEEVAEEAETEHGLARNGLAELKKLQDAPGFGGSVAMLTAGIKHHVKEEEHEVFPKLKANLDRTELSELGAAILKERSGRPAAGRRAKKG
jgi:iron-sulfur cluster repair protein YtfE (RIC family)